MSYGPAHWHCRINKVTLKGNLVAFPGVSEMDLPARSQPDGAVIDLAQDLLTRAESGECQGIAVSWLDKSGQTYSNWAGADRFPVSWLIGSLMFTVIELGIMGHKAAGSVPYKGE